MKVGAEVHCEGRARRLTELIENTFGSDASREAIREVLRERDSCEGLTYGVDRPGTFRLLDRIYRLVAESVGADLKPDCSGTTGKGKCDAAPAVPRLGHVIVGAEHYRGSRHQCHASRVVVQGAHICGYGSEGTAKSGTASTGSEEKKFCRGRPIGGVVFVLGRSGGGEPDEKGRQQDQVSCIGVVHKWA